MERPFLDRRSLSDVSPSIQRSKAQGSMADSWNEAFAAALVVQSLDRRVFESPIEEIAHQHMHMHPYTHTEHTEQRETYDEYREEDEYALEIFEDEGESERGSQSSSSPHNAYTHRETHTNTHTDAGAEPLESFAMRLFAELDELEPEHRVSFQRPLSAPRRAPTHIHTQIHTHVHTRMQRPSRPSSAAHSQSNAHADTHAAQETATEVAAVSVVQKPKRQRSLSPSHRHTPLTQHKQRTQPDSHSQNTRDKGTQRSESSPQQHTQRRTVHSSSAVQRLAQPKQNVFHLRSRRTPRVGIHDKKKTDAAKIDSPLPSVPVVSTDEDKKLDTHTQTQTHTDTHRHTRVDEKREQKEKPTISRPPWVDITHKPLSAPHNLNRERLNESNSNTNGGNNNMPRPPSQSRPSRSRSRTVTVAAAENESSARDKEVNENENDNKDLTKESKAVETHSSLRHANNNKSSNNNINNNNNNNHNHNHNHNQRTNSRSNSPSHSHSEKSDRGNNKAHTTSSTAAAETETKITHAALAQDDALDAERERERERRIEAHKKKTLFHAPHEPSPSLEWSRRFGAEGRRATQRKREKRKELDRETQPPKTRSEDLVELLSLCVAHLAERVAADMLAARDFCTEYSLSLLKLCESNQSIEKDNDKDNVVCTHESMRKALEKVHCGARDANKAQDGLTASQTALQSLLQCLNRVPNARPLEETSTCVMWLLRHAQREPQREADTLDELLDVETIKLMLTVHKSFAHETQQCTSEASAWHTDRSVDREKRERKEVRRVIDRLRDLHVFQEREFLSPRAEKDTRFSHSVLDTATMSMSMSMSPSLCASQVGSQSVIMRRLLQDDNTLQNTLCNAAATSSPSNNIRPEDVRPLRPLSAGPLRALGANATHGELTPRQRRLAQRDEDLQAVLSAAETKDKSEAKNIPTNANTNGKKAEEPPSRQVIDRLLSGLRAAPLHKQDGKLTVLSQVHVGLAAFRQFSSSFASLSADTACLLSAQETHQLHKEGRIIEDSVCIPSKFRRQREKEDQNDTNKNFSRGGVVEEGSLRALNELSHGSVCGFRDVSDESEAGSEQQETRASQRADKYFDLCLPEDEAARHLFLTSAPRLSSEQAFLILFALLSDVIKSFLLEATVLARHALAGKSISPADLQMICGEWVCTVLPKSCLHRFLFWLRANRRTDVNFRPANNLVTELALQRLYSFWPSLSIKLNESSSPSESDNDAECQITLQWSERPRINHDFREPDKFHPNVNRI